MIDPNFSDQEKACLRILAKMFNDGSPFLRTPLDDLKAAGLELDQKSFVVLMRMMEKYGAIENASHSNMGEFRHFSVSAVAVQLVRELDALENKKDTAVDIVESMRLTFRRNPWIAWPFMAVVVVIFVATGINQISGAIKAVVDLFK